MLLDSSNRSIKLTDGNNVALTKFAILDRGYTGHEHLQGVNLIHMNGRLYDSMLHRFLMPDNYVQDPFSTMSFNRYSYVMNNPLMYVDPSGEAWEWIAVGAVAAVYAIFNVVKTIHEKNQYEKNLAKNAPENQVPTPSSGQKSSEKISSSIMPDLPDAYNIEMPLGINPPFDRYKMDSDGNISYYDNKGGSEVDYLMFGEEEIRVNDRSILPQLKDRTIWGKDDSNRPKQGHYAITNNINEALKLYEWIGARSSSEWSFADANTDTGRMALIGTLHEKSAGVAPYPNKGGFGNFTINRFSHSHHGTSWADFNYSFKDAKYMRTLNPKAKFDLYAPLITKKRYNEHVKSKPGYKPIDYEPSKFIPIITD
ncbi:hypothetical protein HCG49_02285 [Arenibacter sp. 6A1]|uniref:RHS repeat domain-containing protein n=1 Tax=Arenibacter sp. 6A1 TaxID=2720391 RepID=UPI001448177C|nr:RHS repeat-associated core domain-containing protein [Arenibacter sp. 6A1]NKI25385.1 hypothetical protein [Arenibacter sp. 6A1]